MSSGSFCAARSCQVWRCSTSRERCICACLTKAAAKRRKWSMLLSSSSRSKRSSPCTAEGSSRFNPLRLRGLQYLAALAVGNAATLVEYTVDGTQAYARLLGNVGHALSAVILVHGEHPVA